MSSTIFTWFFLEYLDPYIAPDKLILALVCLSSFCFIWERWWNEVSPCTAAVQKDSRIRYARQFFRRFLLCIYVITASSMLLTYLSVKIFKLKNWMKSICIFDFLWNRKPFKYINYLKGRLNLIERLSVPLFATDALLR